MPQTNPDEPLRWQTVHWHPDAPAKPPEGAPCNGCGLCCLVEPCPLGMLVSRRRRRRGVCVALRWSAAQLRYQCAMVSDPGAVTGWTNPWAVSALTALARRSIAAGVGCDAGLEVDSVP